MTVTPDAQSAVSSLAVYLRSVAEEEGLRLSAYAESDGLRAGTNTLMGQDLSSFFHFFDRVAFTDDYYNNNLTNNAIGTYLGAGIDERRLLPLGDGYIPAYESYAVQMAAE